MQSPALQSAAANELATRLLTLHGQPRTRRAGTVSARINPGQMVPGRVGQATWRGQTLKFMHTGTASEDGRTFTLRMFG